MLLSFAQDGFAGDTSHLREPVITSCQRLVGGATLLAASDQDDGILVLIPNIGSSQVLHRESDAAIVLKESSTRSFIVGEVIPSESLPYSFHIFNDDFQKFDASIGILAGYVEPPGILTDEFVRRNERKYKISGVVNDDTFGTFSAENSSGFFAYDASPLFSESTILVAERLRNNLKQTHIRAFSFPDLSLLAEAIVPARVAQFYACHEHDSIFYVSYNPTRVGRITINTKSKKPTLDFELDFWTAPDNATTVVLSKNRIYWQESDSTTLYHAAIAEMPYGNTTLVEELEVPVTPSMEWWFDVSENDKGVVWVSGSNNYWLWDDETLEFTARTLSLQ